MADHTAIEWTDATWNPITGCSVHSPGCKHCYAMKLAGTRLKYHWSRKGLTTDTKAGPVWTGEVRFNEEWLDQPLRWKRPRMIFVCAHADLFHENVPDGWIDKIFAVMALCPQHIFQVLTKRDDRMRAYFADASVEGRLARAVLDGAILDPRLLSLEPWPVKSIGDVDQPSDVGIALPLPNVWLGVSVEDQQRAEERIPDLLATPAAVRWLSCEPLLGFVDLEDVRFPEADGGYYGVNALTGAGHRSEEDGNTASDPCEYSRIDWVVGGGESGDGGRPMHPDWARSLRDQCDGEEIPFLFKQWGEWKPIGRLFDDLGDTDETVAAEAALMEAPGREFEDGTLWTDPKHVQMVDAGMHNWANEDAQPPSDVIVIKRVGKKAAGRELDGRTHDGFPT